MMEVLSIALVYVVMLCTTLGTVLVSTVSRVWLAIAVNVVMVDTWYSHAMGATSTTHIHAALVTSVGQQHAVAISPTHVVLVSGIAIAMHGVSTYAHTYMGYEVLSMSFTIELLLFMAVMLLYVYTISLYFLVVLWEYLGMLSYILIQHWGCRSMSTLGSTKSITYNKVLDVLVLSLSAIAWVATTSSWDATLHSTSGSAMDALLLSMVSVKSVTIGLHS